MGHGNSHNPAVAVVGAKKRMKTQGLVREAITHKGAQFIMKKIAQTLPTSRPATPTAGRSLSPTARAISSSNTPTLIAGLR
jgi:hypothetical protein